MTVPELLEPRLRSPRYRRYALLGGLGSSSQPSTVGVQFTAWPFGAKGTTAVGRLQLLQGGRVVASSETTVALVQGDVGVAQLSSVGLQPGPCQALATT